MCVCVWVVTKPNQTKKNLHHFKHYWYDHLNCINQLTNKQIHIKIFLNWLETVLWPAASKFSTASFALHLSSFFYFIFFLLLRWLFCLNVYNVYNTILWLVKLSNREIKKSQRKKTCTIDANEWNWTHIHTSIGDDYCGKGHACHINATCLNLNTKYSCTCRPGFQGNGFDCTGRFKYFFIIQIFNLYHPLSCLRKKFKFFLQKNNFNKKPRCFSIVWH